MKQQNQLFNSEQITTQNITKLTNKSHSFNFLNDESDLYTLEDGEPV